MTWKTHRPNIIERDYNYFRTYDPSTGRDLESDPVGLEGGLNTFAYAAQNPSSYFDNFGLNPLGFALGRLLASGGKSGNSWAGLEVGANLGIVVAGSAGVVTLGNLATGEVCALKYWGGRFPAILISAGASATIQVNGPRCGKDLEGISFELGGQIVAPGVR